MDNEQLPTTGTRLMSLASLEELDNPGSASDSDSTTRPYGLRSIHTHVGLIIFGNTPLITMVFDLSTDGHTKNVFLGFINMSEIPILFLVCKRMAVFAKNISCSRR
ncbi:hypothetical protein PoB_001297300 [Plakobranchus ocellatus]|uniref:G-protein coupled receptors family 1 profile domain-containing protein n=1 Tax=Plakobranchus ocellatus TaxID=259542 RepID=A0AAV3YW58_9GAST|nr:hypothetical protein PoB_001297300 [Plakobranchus ocellatus]